MAADVLVVLASVASALIAGAAAVWSRLAEPRVRKDAAVVESALKLVEQHVREHDRDQRTIDSMRQQINSLSDDLKRCREGLTA